MQHSNTASRLYKLIEDLSKATDTKDQELPPSQIFMKVMSKSPYTQAKFAKSYLNLLQSIEDLRRFAEGASRSKQVFLESVNWLINVSTVLTQSQKWGQVRGQFNIGSHEAKILLSMAELMDEKAVEVEIEEDELEKINSYVWNLMKEIKASDIDEEAKDVLLQYLNNFVAGIDAYRFRGLMGLKEALQRGIGIFVMDHQVLQVQNDNIASKIEKRVDFVNKCLGVATQIGEVCDKYSKGKMLAIGAVEYIKKLGQ